MNCVECGAPLSEHAAACTKTRRAVVRGGKIIGWADALAIARKTMADADSRLAEARAREQRELSTEDRDEALAALPDVLRRALYDSGDREEASLIAFAARLVEAERERDMWAGAALQRDELLREREQLRRQLADLYVALEAVVRIADRQTVEFDTARAALAKARGESK